MPEASPIEVVEGGVVRVVQGTGGFHFKGGGG